MRHLKSTQKTVLTCSTFYNIFPVFHFLALGEKAEDGWKREEEGEEDPIFTSVFPPAGKGKEVIFNFPRPACSAVVGVG